MGDFSTPLSPLDRSVRRKINREIRELTDIRTQMDLTDPYRIFHPNRKEYTFFSAPHGTFSKIDHILSNEKNLNKYKKKNWNNPMYFMRSPWFKIRIQQQY